MKKTIYLSVDFLEWDADVSTSGIGKLDSVKRPYEILSHSLTLLNDKASEFNLSDSIANLKRALNHRLQKLESLYKFKSLKYNGMPKGYLELLENYDIAKPYIIKKLLEIRNNIEHKDAKPPRKDRCKELHDIVWYFLKSTDRLVYYIPHDLTLNPNASQNLPEKYHCSLYINHSRKTISLTGWVPKKYLLDKSNPHSLKIICSVLHDGRYWKGKIEYHKDKTKDDIWIVGQFQLTNETKQAVIKRCFNSY